MISRRGIFYRFLYPYISWNSHEKSMDSGWIQSFPMLFMSLTFSLWSLGLNFLGSIFPWGHLCPKFWIKLLHESRDLIDLSFGVLCVCCPWATDRWFLSVGTKSIGASWVFFWKCSLHRLIRWCPPSGNESVGATRLLTLWILLCVLIASIDSVVWFSYHRIDHRFYT